jgi:hypothetical protein
MLRLLRRFEYPNLHQLMGATLQQDRRSGVVAGLLMQIPYSTEQGIISVEQGIFAQKQEILPSKIQVIAG